MHNINFIGIEFMEIGADEVDVRGWLKTFVPVTTQRQKREKKKMPLYFVCSLVTFEGEWQWGKGREKVISKLPFCPCHSETVTFLLPQNKAVHSFSIFPCLQHLRSVFQVLSRLPRRF